MVFGIDERWTANLIKVINIPKYNRGYRYLLTVVDVFSKYAWVKPVKNKMGTDGDGPYGKDPETKWGKNPNDSLDRRRQGILQQDVSSTDETKRHSSFLYKRQHQSHCCGTVKSDPETMSVPLLYHEKHLEFLPHVTRSGEKVQSILLQQHQDGPQGSH